MVPQQQMDAYLRFHFELCEQLPVSATCICYNDNTMHKENISSID